MDYTIVGLKELYFENEKDKYIQDICTNFGSNIKGDSETEDFLFRFAFEYEYQDKSRTYFIYNNSNEIVGYFSLSGNKIIKSQNISNKIGKLLGGIKICANSKDKRCYIFSSILLGQLSRNNKLFSSNDVKGSVLLNCALNKIKDSYDIVGGRCITVDCVDELVDFYSSYGFVKIDKTKNLNHMYALTKNVFKLNKNI